MSKLISTILLLLLSLGLVAPAAHASDKDWETVLGIVIAGGIIWGLANDDHHPAPPPQHHYAPPRYDPPSPHQRYGSPNYWYHEGYSDGWSDGRRIPHRPQAPCRPGWSSPLPPSWHGQVPPQYRRDPWDRGPRH